MIGALAPIAGFAISQAPAKVEFSVFVGRSPSFYDGPNDSCVTLTSSTGEKYFSVRERESSEYRFKSVPRGTFRLVVNDPRFELQIIEGVDTSKEHFRCHVRGKAKLVLTPGDETTRQHWEQIEFHVRSVGNRSLQVEEPIAAEDIIKYADSCTLCLPPGDFGLKVSSPGLESKNFQSGMLQTGTSTQTSIVLGLGFTIEGGVRESDGSTPQSPVRVFFFSPAQVNDSERSNLAFRIPNIINNLSWQRIEQFRVMCDRKGVFRWEGASSGTYLAYADAGSGIESDFVKFELGSAPRKGPSAINLQLPRRCEVLGSTSVINSGRLKTGAKMELTYIDGQGHMKATKGVELLGFIVTTDEAGKFRFSGIPPGRARIRVRKYVGPALPQSGGHYPEDDPDSILAEKIINIEGVEQVNF